MSCDPQELILDARCLSCLTENDRDLVKTNLLCQLIDSLNGTVTVVIPTTTAIAATQVSVPITEVPVPASNMASRKRITIKALSANGDKVYIGLTGVTANTGFELNAGSSVDIDADWTVNLFAISASGTQRVSTLETS